MQNNPNVIYYCPCCKTVSEKTGGKTYFSPISFYDNCENGCRLSDMGDTSFDYPNDTDAPYVELLRFDVEEDVVLNASPKNYDEAYLACKDFAIRREVSERGARFAQEIFDLAVSINREMPNNH